MAPAFPRIGPCEPDGDTLVGAACITMQVVSPMGTAPESIGINYLGA